MEITVINGSPRLKKSNSEILKKLFVKFYKRK